MQSKLNELHTSHPSISLHFTIRNTSCVFAAGSQPLVSEQGQHTIPAAAGEGHYSLFLFNKPLNLHSTAQHSTNTPHTHSKCVFSEILFFLFGAGGMLLHPRALNKAADCSACCSHCHLGLPIYIVKQKEDRRTSADVFSRLYQERTINWKKKGR